MRIIILTGNMGNGKDTCASIIRRKVDNTKSVAFADPIKQISGILFGWNQDHFNGWCKEIDDHNGIIPRKFYRKFGDWGRNTLPRWFPKYNGRKNLWVNIAIEKIKQFDDEAIVLITDARYPNEVEAIKRTFGPESVVVVRVVRELAKLTWWEKLFAHSSEKALDKIKADWTIENSTLENLEKCVEVMLYNEGVLE